MKGASRAKPGLRRFKVRVVTPTSEYWTEPVWATTLMGALAQAAGRLPGALSEGGVVSVVPEEGWPAAEREREIILGDSVF